MIWQTFRHLGARAKRESMSHPKVALTTANTRRQEAPVPVKRKEERQDQVPVGWRPMLARFLA